MKISMESLEVFVRVFVLNFWDSGENFDEIFEVFSLFYLTKTIATPLKFKKGFHTKSPNNSLFFKPQKVLLHFPRQILQKLIYFKVVRDLKSMKWKTTQQLSVHTQFPFSTETEWKTFELIYRLNGHEILIYSRGNKKFTFALQKRENVSRNS